MHLADDHIQPTPRGGRCRVRVFLPDEDRDAPVVILTELANNPGQSVTNAAGRIAADLSRSYGLPERTVWIEHYERGGRGTTQDPETFDLLMFRATEARQRFDPRDGPGEEFGGPVWKALDRASVEALVGRGL